MGVGRMGKPAYTVERDRPHAYEHCVAAWRHDLLPSAEWAALRDRKQQYERDLQAAGGGDGDGA